MLRHDAPVHISGCRLDGRTRLRHKAADLQAGYDEMIALTPEGNRIIYKDAVYGVKIAPINRVSLIFKTSL